MTTWRKMVRELLLVCSIVMLLGTGAWLIAGLDGVIWFLIALSVMGYFFDGVTTIWDVRPRRTRKE